ncbi:hypothetical protein H4S07_001543 [Coemansia furcata]|uniref:Uncharacterized protein n=1 Tax=Coemansia furcata TaxID=417177 RepID=A0ACC1LN60_9FUNG|nr:hypothetical protein H4S07_001543 [Coemansia furcata]
MKQKQQMALGKRQQQQMVLGEKQQQQMALGEKQQQQMALGKRQQQQMVLSARQQCRKLQQMQETHQEQLHGNLLALHQQQPQSRVLGPAQQSLPKLLCIYEHAFLQTDGLSLTHIGI